MGASVTSIAGAPAIIRPAVDVGDGGVHDVPVLEYRPEPWGRRDVILFGVLSTIGAVLLGAAWFGSGDGQTINGQVVYIDLAVGGVLTGSLGGALWLLTGLRGVRLRKASVKARVASRAGVGADMAGGAPAAAAGTLVANSQMTRYHEARCSLVAGKATSAASQAEHERAGRRPCGMCIR